MVAQLIRLKLKLTWNTLRQPTWVLVITILGMLYFLGMLSGATVGVVLATLADVNLFPAWIIGGGLVLFAWVVGPALFRSLDNTLDPRRFAPHVGASSTLAAGLVAGTGIGIAGLFSFLALLIPVASMIIAGNFLSAALALVLGFVGLLSALLWSRALTTWMGVTIEASGKKDLYTALASVLILAICVPAGFWMQTAANSVDSTIWDQLTPVMAWTPFGAPWAISLDAINGTWALAVGRLAVMAVWAAAGWALWMKVLPWAMSGTANKLTNQAKQAILRGDTDVDSAKASPRPAQKPGSAPNEGKLVGMRGVEAWQRLGLSPAAASLAQHTARDWFRDPRLLTSLVAVAMMAVIGCLPQFMNRPDDAVTGEPIIVVNSFLGTFFVLWAPMLLGAVVGALDMYESTAMWIYVATGMKGRDNRLARLVGSLPVSILLILATCGVYAWFVDFRPTSTALLVTGALLSYCCSVAVTLVENARWVYPVQPPGTSAFSSKGTGQFGATMLVQTLGWLGAVVLAIPGIILLALVTWTSWVPVVVAVPITVVWSVATLVVAVIWGGKVWDRYSVSVLTKIKSWPGH